MAEIIDFEKKGNIVRFYLGRNAIQTGDDWDDTPYEHNAGKVYDEFIVGFKDITFPFDSLVLEPCDGTDNSIWCKDDMKERRVPCIVVLDKEYLNYNDNFDTIVTHSKAKRYYFGDEI